jgi:hypothetical protein
MGEIYQVFKGKIIPILCNLLQWIKEERILSKTVYDASITLILKPKTKTERGSNTYLRQNGLQTYID